ncbi:helix-turn-helix transcriptional regulator, partial [Streptomyces sp. WAC06614]|uniref:helix-turn-helix domain-containing protein n=1 Tax=Streptomyces sp. WAC06614 TaxID=2487416 RepID=UPI000FAE7342
MTQSADNSSEPSLPSSAERRRLREAADLGPAEVAAAIGVSPATVRSWEAGRTEPQGRKRAAYARLLARLAGPSGGGSSRGGRRARRGHSGGEAARWRHWGERGHAARERTGVLARADAHAH